MTLKIILAMIIVPVVGIIVNVYRDRKHARLARELAEAEAERKAAAAKRAAQEAEYRRRQEAEARKAAKAAEHAQKLAEKKQRENERKAAAEAKHAESMRRREELHQQKMRHMAELQAAQAKLQTAQEERQDNPAPAPVEVADEAGRQETEQQEAATVDESQPAAVTFDAPFAGKTVAFTGKIPGFTHEEAAKAVQLRGGRAFAKAMPAGTNLLVVGQQEGDGTSNKMQKADELIGQIRKITAAQFIQLINTFPI